MKKYIAYLFLLATPLMTANASQYVSVHAGPSIIHNTTGSSSRENVGLNTGITYGYAFESGIRTEIQTMYHTHKRKTENYKMFPQAKNSVHSSNHAWHYMVNILCDMHTLRTESVVPYLGIGMGWCQNTNRDKIKTYDYTGITKTKNDRFAWQAIAGMKYPINETLSAALEYKYLVGDAHARNHGIGIHIIRAF